jgi:hypothetical protein
MEVSENCKSRRMRWVGHSTWVKQQKCVHGFGGKNKGKRLLGSLWHG